MRRSHGPRRKARAGMNKERSYRDLSVRDFEACPRPDKRVFVGRRESEAAAKESRKLGLPRWTYLCACGRWHLTKMPPTETTPCLPGCGFGPLGVTYFHVKECTAPMGFGHERDT